MYYAIGKEEFDKLPSMFANSEFAKTLSQDEWWWGYLYMFPHQFRDEMCTIDMWIKFTHSDGTFKKVYWPA